VWSIAAGCRSPAVVFIDLLLIFCAQRLSTDSQRFSAEKSQDLLLRRFTQQKINNGDSGTAAAGCNAPYWSVSR